MCLCANTLEEKLRYYYSANLLVYECFPFVVQVGALYSTWSFSILVCFKRSVLFYFPLFLCLCPIDAKTCSGDRY